VLVFESPSGSVLESPDNLCLTPNGGVLFCEDDAVSDDDTHPLSGALTDINRLVGLGPKGEIFTFAVNILNDSEFAGACFSPDGEILFVNLFGGSAPGSGMTCAIWGPWERGPL
jgi:secreted PhoX family phosphatase